MTIRLTCVDHHAVAYIHQSSDRSHIRTTGDVSAAIPKVKHLDPPVGVHGVAGFQVTVHDAFFVSCFQCPGRLPGDVEAASVGILARLMRGQTGRLQRRAAISATGCRQF